MKTKEELQRAKNRLVSAPEVQAPEHIVYYVVLYLYDRTVHLAPFDTKEDAERSVAKFMKGPKKDLVKTHHIIKRDLSKYDGDMFL